MALELYKKGQGTLARSIAYGIVAGLIVFGAIRLYVAMGFGPLLEVLVQDAPLVGDVTVRKVLAIVVALLSIVGLHAILNRPQSVDLLIETEQEMKKVSWPTLPDVWNATGVVILVTATLAITMSAFDFGLRRMLILIFGS
jgi:preprotein translocase SecE subunit